MPKQHTNIPQDPTFTLLVSNQSFDLDPVDIEVKIDGRLAVTGDFVVGNQHTWVKFDFDLGAGNHTLTAKSRDGGVDLEKPFVMNDRKWGVLNFWYYASGPEPTPEQFSFSVSDEQPAFD